MLPSSGLPLMMAGHNFLIDPIGLVQDRTMSDIKMAVLHKHQSDHRTPNGPWIQNGYWVLIIIQFEDLIIQHRD